MMRCRGRAALWTLGILLVSSALASAEILITEDEAKPPPPKGAVANSQRGVTRGPKIEFVGDPNPVHSPVHLQLRFVSFGGAKIDLDSVRMTYLRTPNVDLTPRITSFLQASGIDIPDAELPIGYHLIRVEIKDSEGRYGSNIFALQVTP